jgi:hypothetical protein
MEYAEFTYWMVVEDLYQTTNRGKLNLDGSGHQYLLGKRLVVVKYVILLNIAREGTDDNFRRRWMGLDIDRAGHQGTGFVVHPAGIYPTDDLSFASSTWAMPSPMLAPEGLPV